MNTYQVLTHPNAPAPRLSSPSVQAASQLLHDLLGDEYSLDSVASPKAFLPRGRHRGLCRACGALTNLSFEHMPPSASGNNTRARGANALSILTSADPHAFPASGWFPSQRGIGAYVLCKPCNELFGSKYVNAYVAFADKVGLGAIEAIQKQESIPGTVDIALRDWELGDIGRAGLVQLLALGVHDRLIRRFPTLSSAVLKGDEELPEGLRLGLTLILNTARGRVSAPTILVTNEGTPNEDVTVFSEVAVAPFAWTLSFTGEGRRPLVRTADVSHWLRLGPSETATMMPVALPVGTIASAVPGDYSFHDALRSRSTPTSEGATS